MRTLLCLAALIAVPLVAQEPGSDPVDPFRIAGNIYYVGASDVTSFLITTPQGHILIDGGYPEMATQIEHNITTLGFRVKDVRIILISHAHFDHAGAVAELRRITGAKVMAGAGDVALLARGGRDDPQFGAGAQSRAQTRDQRRHRAAHATSITVARIFAAPPLMPRLRAA